MDRKQGYMRSMPKHKAFAVATGIKSTRNEAAGERGVEKRQREKDRGSGIAHKGLCKNTVRIFCHVDKRIFSVA